MRLQCRLLQNAPDHPVADTDALPANPFAEQCARPVRYRYAYVFGQPTGFAFDARCIGVREREGGRPERGASFNAAAGSSACRKRCRHFSAVRGCTPRARATSCWLTPSAISSSAAPRSATRFSAFAGRIAAATASRCSGDSGNGFARGPGCGRCTHGSGSIMLSRYRSPKPSAKFSPNGTRPFADARGAHATRRRR